MHDSAEQSEHHHVYVEAVLTLLVWSLKLAFSVMCYLKPSWIRWCPTSEELLLQAETQMLSHLKGHFKLSNIEIQNYSGIPKTLKIRTLIIQGDERATPLVLLHGFGSGLAMWALNLDELSQAGRRTVYAIDILGFGLSSRARFSEDAAGVETQFVSSIESWREQMNIQNAIFIGHAFGGFVATSYAMEHPQRVAHLILVEPWGLSGRSSFTEKYLIIPAWAKLLVAAIHAFNPLGILRLVGPLGCLLVAKLRPDLRKKFDHVITDPSYVPKYLYHVNVQEPSGEAAFRCLTNYLGWARRPLLKRITQLSSSLSITFVHGSRSRVSEQLGLQVQHIRFESNTDVVVIKGAGHHVYADKPDNFNELVGDIADRVDRKRVDENSNERIGCETPLNSWVEI